MYSLQGLGSANCPECGLAAAEFADLLQQHDKHVPQGMTLRTSFLAWFLAAPPWALIALLETNSAVILIAGVTAAVAGVLGWLHHRSKRPALTLRRITPHIAKAALQQALLLGLLSLGTMLVLTGLGGVLIVLARFV